MIRVAALFCAIGLVYGQGSYTRAPAQLAEEFLPMTAPMNNVNDVTVSCDLAQGTMNIVVQFDRPFEGALYAKGLYKSENCRAVPRRGNRRITLSLPLDGCGTNSDTQGEGYDQQTYYSNTVIVMNEFAWGILEMGDRAYDVSCRFGGTNVETLNYDLSLPMIDAVGVSQAPVEYTPCHMKVVSGQNPTISGVSRLEIGQLGTLAFWIENKGLFDLTVYDCYAHDGMGMSRLALVDDDGCPAHKKVIGQSQHNNGLVNGQTFVYAHFKTFKFPDVNNVYFVCQCRVCFNHCYPPVCESDSTQTTATTRRQTGGGRRRRTKRETGDENDTATTTTGIDGETLDENKLMRGITVVVPSVETIVYDESTGAVEREVFKVVQNEEDICVQRSTLIAAIASMMACMVLALIAAGLIVVRARKYAVDSKLGHH